VQGSSTLRNRAGSYTEFVTETVVDVVVVVVVVVLLGVEATGPAM